MRRAAGFTALELLVTLALLAILAGLGLPSFRAGLERQRVSAALFLASAHFSSARMTAITTRSVVSLCPAQGDDTCAASSDWNREWLMYRGRRRAPQPESPAALLRRLPPPAHPSLRLHVSGGRRALHFQPDGRSSGSNLRVRVCLEGRLRGEVVVNNVGRVRSRRLPGTQGCGY